MEKIEIQIYRHDDCRDLPLPKYMTEHAAGMDLFAAVEQDLVLESGQWARVPTGISFALPDGYEAQVRPRSGLAFRDGIGLLNSPGTIDSDYRGEIGVLMINHGHDPFTIRRGDRIAQMVIAPVTRAEWVQVDKLPDTRRSSGGFGHTGTNGINR